MNVWEELHLAIKNARAERKDKDWRNALIVQLGRAADLDVCPKWAKYQVTSTSSGKIEITQRGGCVIKTVSAEVPAIPLMNLPVLDDALLAFRVVLQRDLRRVAQYTMSVVGTDKTSKRPWYVRIDLDSEQRGAGPCSHAMLHCHVGDIDSGDSGGQEVRVPLPWLDPDAALAWILATVEPKLEPKVEP